MLNVVYGGVVLLLSDQRIASFLLSALMRSTQYR
jgi:hypothetical protein